MIWIIGCNGMLGTEITELLKKEKIDYVGTDRECDITDIEALRNYVRARSINWIINCSAYTAVDKAEDEEDAAYRINAAGAGNIAKIASEVGAKMIHISTDYVFDGKGTRPYNEDDEVSPTGAYGRTKLAGERLVVENCRQSFIIRTAWLYGKHGNNFVETMLRLFNERDSLNVVNDQKGSPTWAYDLASVIVYVYKNNFDGYGIYHFTDNGEITWYEFASEIYRLAREQKILSREVAINPVTSDKYPTKAERPKWSVLSKQKISSAGVVIPDWKDSLSAYMNKRV